MGRIIIILLVSYLILLLLKSVLKIWRGNSRNRNNRKSTQSNNRVKKGFDKSKAVDAEFEEIN